MTRSLLLLALAASPALALPPNFVEKTYTDAKGEQFPYVVYVPPGSKPDAKPPVILSLHGSGETKGGSKMPVEVGLGTHIKDVKDFPAVVVIPQCQARRTGWRADGQSAQLALAMLDETIKAYRCDESRQYLTGLSMGGYGTWSILAAYPDRFAAAVPICGGGDPAKAAKFKDVPVWCFHGGADPVVKPELSRAMVAALKKAGSEVKYTEYEGVGHNSWDKAYSTPGLYEWLFAQKKK